MRGSKSGVEVRIREKAVQLLDIDGDSCHHIHNACKKFCAPFENWLEGLLCDLHNDFKWSSDLRDWLSDLCDILHVKFTMAQRYVSHRWLSVYDVALATDMLFDCYITFYYGFIPKTLQPNYTEILESIYEKKGVSKEARERIAEIHHQLAVKMKTLTDDGKKRKERIVEKVLIQSKKTTLQLHFYIAALPILQKYVKVFQSKEIMIHRLHDQQLESFQSFHVCFVKPEKISGLSAKGLKSIQLNEDQGQFLKIQDMFVGAEVDKIISESSKGDHDISDFLKMAAASYVKCAIHMQAKLPLDNGLLRALSCIDPAARGHTVTAVELKKLTTVHMRHFLVNEEQATVGHEVLMYQVDDKLPEFEGQDIGQWWAKITKLKKYPGLCKVVAAALSIFHGPQVESSFNLMGDIMDPKSSRLNVETFNSLQTVKYTFLSKKTTSVKYFDRPSCKYSEVNLRLCRNLRDAAAKHKKANQIKAEQKKSLQEKLKINTSKKVSKIKAKEKTQQSVEAARQQHVNQQKKEARKRALEGLVESVQKKKKSN
ncbi:hypothetical protein SNE40_018313 [Patella caerulea]|uniref:HAT C-terminal dimerisation domain-containing protein n=1 Tax=Patella caerulea TaxID=87958 RepID=A0AAN8JAV7_PATCE